MGLKRYVEQHRVKNVPTGEWWVKRAGAERASAVFDMRGEALEWAALEAAKIDAVVIAEKGWPEVTTTDHEELVAIRKALRKDLPQIHAQLKANAKGGGVWPVFIGTLMALLVFGFLALLLG